MNNFFDNRDTKIKKACAHRVALVERVQKMYRLTLKGQFQNLTSGLGQVMTLM